MNRQRQDAQVFDWDEAVGAVELQRGDVSWLGLDGKTDGPGVSSRLMNRAQQRPPDPAAPGTGDNVEIPQLPKAAQPERRGNTHCRRQASQLAPDMGGKDSEPPLTGLLRQPRK